MNDYNFEFDDNWYYFIVNHSLGFYGCFKFLTIIVVPKAISSTWDIF